MTEGRRIDFQRVRAQLQDFKFKAVFVEELGWSNPSRGLRETTVDAAGVELRRRPIAELSGFVVFEVEATAGDGAIPDAKTRASAHKVIGGLHHEHVLVFVDRARQKSVWSWVHRKDGKDHLRTHHYFRGQPGDLFIGKLGSLMFDLGDFDQEGNVSIVEVAQRVRKALDVEKVTKKFYTGFQEQHVAFLELVRGIADDRQRQWYVSVLLNRLMFIYFLQKKGFLDRGNRDYLQDRLAWSRRTLGEDRYFSRFLELLFFQGFAMPEDRRSAEARERLGHVRYLNGGLFLRHRVELDNPGIDVPDQAFENLFALFGSYTWYLDDTPGGDDSAINPDVLGYIFEKYINQKSFGAYYTRPEITDWLCEETIHRRVLDRVNELEGVTAGAHFDEMSDLLLNLTPALCRLLLGKVLPDLSVLDPACGSGAFLVAALKTMLGVYGAVVGAAKTLPDEALKAEVKGWEAAHPSLGYYLKKRVIVGNLYGVDLMEEAAEIARLRLFLSLVASASREEELEPLPNIDFNVMAGNSLVDDVFGSKGEVDVVVTNTLSAIRFYHASGHEGRRPGSPYFLAERCFELLRDKGQFGLVLPVGVYRDESTKGLREMLFEHCALRTLIGFADEPSRGQEHRAICCLVGGKGGSTKDFFVSFGAGEERMDARLGEFLRDPGERLMLTPDFVRRASPRTLSVMELKSAFDLSLVEKLSRHPLLGDDGQCAWSVEGALGVQMQPSRQSGQPKHVASSAVRSSAVYAANAIRSYEWTPDVPRSWAGQGAGVRRPGFLAKLKSQGYVIGLRNITSKADGRMLSAALIPPGIVVDESVTVLWLKANVQQAGARRGHLAADLLYVLALLNGYPLDWILRLRAGRRILMSHVYQLPLPRLTPKDAVFVLIVERAAKLTCTTQGFDALVKEAGLNRQVRGVTQREERAALRAELDGLIAHLYGLTEEEFARMLASFPVVPEPQRVAARNAYRAVARGDVQ
jgi:hypothetical protein